MSKNLKEIMGFFLADGVDITAQQLYQLARNVELKNGAEWLPRYTTPELRQELVIFFLLLN
jgi:hypothetical protein